MGGVAWAHYSIALVSQPALSAPSARSSFAQSTVTDAPLRKVRLQATAKRCISENQRFVCSPVVLQELFSCY